MVIQSTNKLKKTLRRNTTGTYSTAIISPNSTCGSSKLYSSSVKPKAYTISSGLGGVVTRFYLASLTFEGNCR